MDDNENYEMTPENNDDQQDEPEGRHEETKEEVLEKTPDESLLQFIS